MKNPNSKIKFNSVILENFKVTTGVRESDGLSPVFFNIVLGSVVRVLQYKLFSLNIGYEKQIVLATYPVDIVVVAETKDSLKKTTEKIIKVVNIDRFILDK